MKFKYLTLFAIFIFTNYANASQKILPLCKIKSDCVKIINEKLTNELKNKIHSRLNIIIELTFDKSSKVTSARILRTSGYSKADRKILTNTIKSPLFHQLQWHFMNEHEKYKKITLNITL